MMDLQKANKIALEAVARYRGLDIFGTKVVTPYFMNNIGNYIKDLLKQAAVPEKYTKKVHELYKEKKVPYGWGRGKGTPEDIETAATEISRLVGLPLENGTEDGIRAFMQAFGIGVDCSGFVFNILDQVTKALGTSEQYLESLAWADKEEVGANNAGTFVFADPSSTPVEHTKLQPLDLLLFKSMNHIALVLMEEDKLLIAQSSLTVLPSGVSLLPLKTSKSAVDFKFEQAIGPHWNKLYADGIIEFRRLKIFDEK